MSGNAVQKKRKMEGALPEVEQTKLETLRHLFAPLSKDQVVEILCKAANQHEDVFQEAKMVVSASPAARRLMVRNIAFGVSTEELRTAMEKFGEVEDCAVVCDRSTGKSRGFGFVTFKSIEAVEAAVKAQVSLQGRDLLIKLAADHTAGDANKDASGPAPMQTDAGAGAGGGAGHVGGDVSKRKLFVRNMSESTSEQSLRVALEPFGEVEETAIIRNPDGKPKGYGFVVMRHVQGANEALSEGEQMVIDGRMCFISLASAKPAPKSAPPAPAPPSAPGLTQPPPPAPQAPAPPSAPATGLSSLQQQQLIQHLLQQHLQQQQTQATPSLLPVLQPAPPAAALQQPQQAMAVGVPPQPLSQQQLLQVQQRLQQQQLAAPPGSAVHSAHILTPAGQPAPPPAVGTPLGQVPVGMPAGGVGVAGAGVGVAFSQQQLQALATLGVQLPRQ